MDEIKEKLKKLKQIKIIVLIGGGFFFFIIMIAALIAIIPGGMNGIQSVGQNSSSTYVQDKTKYETGKNSIFTTLCQNCTEDPNSLDRNGVLGSEFYQKMSEMMNLYNSLEIKKERIDEFDFQLLSATLQYGKLLRAEIFTDSDQFGKWYNEKTLTNKDIDHFYGISDITRDNAQQFFKWAAVMLGTPYSLPDINLRGLSGNLMTGKIITTCTGGRAKSEKDQKDDLVKQIIDIEKKLSGETVENTENFWDNILSFLGLSYKADDTLLEERIIGVLEDNSNYEDLKVYINLDDFGFDKCSGGAEHTYIKFMNYEQYKEYLRKVFIPQNFINCEKCLLKDASEYNKKIKTEDILKEIFEIAEYFHSYANMSNFSYDNIMYGEQIEIGDLSKMSSPLKERCAVTSAYGYRNGVPHYGVDTTFPYSSDKSIYAIADGTVHIVDSNQTEKLPCTDYDCPCALESNIRNNGVYVVLKHEINGVTYYSQYAHLSPDGIELRKGDRVTKGQKIANMGNTGCSSGTHLHFGLYKDSYSEGTEVNPTTLFRQCENSGISGQIKVTTTDNFVTPEKCMIDNYTLDEIIASKIKEMDSTLSKEKEAVKATAVVIRTAIMHDSNWCNDRAGIDRHKPKKYVDIEKSATDLNLYNQVIETQGMILNYSGETIDNAKYTTFPCEWLPLNNWRAHQALVFSKIGARINFLDKYGELDDNAVEVAIRAYNNGCVSYQESDPAIVNLSTITENVWKGLGLKDGSVRFAIPRSWITKTEWNLDVGEKFATDVAKYLAASSKDIDYTEILYQFYRAKAINQQDLTVTHGVVDISTSPGLLDAKKLVSRNLGNNTEGFKYGETLAGTNRIPPAPSEELQEINESLKQYINEAETKAKNDGANVNKAKIAAAAYWLVNNIYYKVQYASGNLSQYNVTGFNPNWNETIGLDSKGFVLWSLRQANVSNTILQNPRKTSSKFTIEDLIQGGVEIGDIIGKQATTDANAHFAIITEVDDLYIKIAHATNEQSDLVITTHYINDEIDYQYLY